MYASNKVVERLLALQEQTSSKGSQCVTIYHPLDNPSKTIIAREVRARVVNCLKESMWNKDNLPGQVADMVALVIGGLPIFHKSIGIFLVMDEADPEKVVLGENLEVILSSVSLPQHEYCGAIFDLGLTAKMLKSINPTLILNISRDGTDFYKSEGEKFVELFTLRNNIKEAMEERYTDRTPGTDGVMHSGSNAFEKSLKFALKHTTEVIEKAKELVTQDKSYKNILIFHSDDFGTYAAKFANELKPLVEGDLTVRLTNVDAGNDPKEEAERILEELTETKISEALAKAQTSTDKKYVEGWNFVSEASRSARIQTLYYREQASRPGFIDQNNLVYVEDEPNTERVGDILPRIIINVLTTGGEVVVLAKESAKINADAAAQLRY